MQNALPAWELDLAQAAAWLKLGRLDEAVHLLRAVAEDADFAAAVAVARPPSRCRELTQCHWLRPLARVAIESEHAAAVLPQLWAMGLEQQARRDPQLGEQLLVNALQQGRLDVVVALRGWNVPVRSETAQAIRQHARWRAAAFADKHGPHSHRRAGNQQALAFLRAAFVALGWETGGVGDSTYEREPKGPCRRMRALLSAVSPWTAASPDAPRRRMGFLSRPAR